MGKHPLQDLLEQAGHMTRSYSGRGMYGASCLGLDLSHSQIGEVMGDLLREVASAAWEGPIGDVADALRDMRWDSMGLGTIYYFPRVPHVDEEEDGDGHGD